MSPWGWIHNIQYHDVVLSSVPQLCRRALDVGCGTGLLARGLGGCCEEVVAIDPDRGAISRAKAASASNPSISFVEGDVLTHPFLDGSLILLLQLRRCTISPETRPHPLPEPFENGRRSGGCRALSGGHA